MNTKEQALVRLTQSKVVSTMRLNGNFGTSEIGNRIRDVLETDVNFGMECLTGLSAAVNLYNGLELADEMTTFLKASARLKPKIPQLPSPHEMLSEISSNRNGSRWGTNFLLALTSLNEKIDTGDLKWYKQDQATSEALAAGGVAHEFEEKLLADKEITYGQTFEIDEVVDVLMEMLLWKCPENQFSQWLNKPINEGGLGWATSYDNLSPELRNLRGLE